MLQQQAVRQAIEEAKINALLKRVPRREGRALVISGGGAWGAYAVGLLQGLGHEYQAAAGISTGNLIAPIALRGPQAYNQLARAYTQVNLKRIFAVSPFTKRGKIRVLNAAKRMILQGKPSAGVMTPLKSLIREYYPYEDHLKNCEQGKIAICGAFQITDEPYDMDWRYSHQTDYATMVDAMYASCCFWPVAEPAIVDGRMCVDGGFVEKIPIDEVLALGFRTVDVIVLEEHKPYKVRQPHTNKWLKIGGRIVKGIRHDTVYENLRKQEAVAIKTDEVTINVYYTPHKLSENAMYFNEKEMKGWVNLGRQMATNEDLREVF